MTFNGTTPRGKFGESGITSGNLTLICTTPATKPGAAPAYSTVNIGPPATAICTAAPYSSGRNSSGVTSPATLGGTVGPPPVPNNTTLDPFFAGLRVEFTVPSSFNAAAGRFGEPSTRNSAIPAR